MSGAWRFQLLGYSVGLARPLALVLLALALVLGALAVWAALRRRARLLGWVAPRHATRLAPGVSRTRPALSAGLNALGLALMALALAQPQCGTKTEATKKRGIDVVVALDASRSMLARDVQPSRLERAKLELTTLLDELKGDRVGLVAFAGDAFIQSPLTGDYAAVKLFLRAVDPEDMPQGGTNVGAALRLSRQLLEGADRGAKDRVVVLLSDGEDLFGELGSAVRELEEAGIKVLAVGVGGEGGEPLPELDEDGNVVGYKRDAAGQVVLSRLNRAGLEAIARETGGELFYQPRGVAMGQVVERIDRMQKTELESRLTVRYDERFQAFLWPGLALWVAGLLVPTSRRRRPRAGRAA